MKHQILQCSYQRYVQEHKNSSCIAEISCLTIKKNRFETFSSFRHRILDCSKKKLLHQEASLQKLGWVINLTNPPKSINYSNTTCIWVFLNTI
jgi:hypothetical protein